MERHYRNLFKYSFPKNFLRGKREMIDTFKALLNKLIPSLFAKKKHMKIGLYGPPNSGKTSTANRICKDWLGEDVLMGTVSEIAHETREIQTKENIHMKKKGKELTFNLIDTPGIATKIDYEDFLKHKLNKKVAKERAKEATKGVIEAIKWLDNMDCVIVVLDSTTNPYSQVNITIIGNLAARNIPVVIAANKIDLKKANVKSIEAAFPQYPVIGISAEEGTNMEELYESIVKMVK